MSEARMLELSELNLVIRTRAKDADSGLLGQRGPLALLSGKQLVQIGKLFGLKISPYETIQVGESDQDDLMAEDAIFLAFAALPEEILVEELWVSVETGQGVYVHITHEDGRKESFSTNNQYTVWW